jgi:hypothetical protein
MGVAPTLAFGVNVETLRHEVMHAELHAGAGCMPIWFNEGMAMRFAHEIPKAEWFGMLRERRTLDLASLSSPSIRESQPPEVGIVYAQSLAMVLYVEDHGSLVWVTHDLRSAGWREAEPNARTLWSRLYPTVTSDDLLASLGKRILGVPSSADLAAIFSAAICCHGRRLDNFGCWGAPLRPDKTVWFDASRPPAATCRPAAEW